MSLLTKQEKRILLRNPTIERVREVGTLLVVDLRPFYVVHGDDGRVIATIDNSRLVIRTDMPHHKPLASHYAGLTGRWLPGECFVPRIAHNQYKIGLAKDGTQFYGTNVGHKERHPNVLRSGKVCLGSAVNHCCRNLSKQKAYPELITTLVEFMKNYLPDTRLITTQQEE